MVGSGRHAVRVQGTLVQFQQPFGVQSARRPPSHVVVDIRTPAGEVVRAVFKQHFTWDISDPSPGDAVPVDWDARRHQARLALQGDPRYDRKFARKQRKAGLEAARAPQGEEEPQSS